METNLLGSHSLAHALTHACANVLSMLQMLERLRSLVMEMPLKERMSWVCRKTEVKNMP
jgi:hypothetical protein